MGRFNLSDLSIAITVGKEIVGLFGKSKKAREKREVASALIKAKAIEAGAGVVSTFTANLALELDVLAEKYGAEIAKVDENTLVIKTK